MAIGHIVIINQHKTHTTTRARGIRAEQLLWMCCLFFFISFIFTFVSFDTFCICKRNFNRSKFICVQRMHFGILAMFCVLTNSMVIIPYVAPFSQKEQTQIQTIYTLEICCGRETASFASAMPWRLFNFTDADPLANSFTQSSECYKIIIRIVTENVNEMKATTTSTATNHKHITMGHIK